MEQTGKAWELGVTTVQHPAFSLGNWFLSNFLYTPEVHSIEECVNNCVNKCLNAYGV